MPLALKNAPHGEGGADSDSGAESPVPPPPEPVAPVRRKKAIKGRSASARSSDVDDMDLAPEARDPQLLTRRGVNVAFNFQLQ